MDIDHDPDEPKIDRERLPKWPLFTIFPFLWVCYLYTETVDWFDVLFGAVNMMVALIWFFDWYGVENLNKSLRQPPRSNRP